MTAVDLRSLTVIRHASLGVGGSASGVYRCTTDSGQKLIYKEYRSEIRSGIDAAVLSANALWRLALTRQVRDHLDRVASWPVAVVKDRGSLVGVLMKRAPGTFMEADSKSLRDLSALARDTEYSERHGLQHFLPPQKLSCLGHMFETLGFLHAQGVVVGDLQFKNILVSDGPGPLSTYFLDCDAMLLAGRSASRHALDPETWRVPGTSGFSASTDLYKAALAVVRCLAERPAWSPGGAATNLDPLLAWMPTEDVKALLRMLSAESAVRATVSAQALAPMASAWRQLVSPAGAMYLRNDKFALTAWRDSSLRATGTSQDSRTRPTTPSDDGRAKPSAPARNVVTPDVETEPTPEAVHVRSSWWRRLFRRGK